MRIAYRVKDTKCFEYDRRLKLFSLLDEESVEGENYKGMEDVNGRN